MSWGEHGFRDYFDFVRLMQQSWLVLTDSGGIQEEAPALGKPVLVLRNRTERLEGVEAGMTRLVGTETDSIVEAVSHLVNDVEAYQCMSVGGLPYGDGKAAERICDILEKSVCSTDNSLAKSYWAAIGRSGERAEQYMRGGG